MGLTSLKQAITGSRDAVTRRRFTSYDALNTWERQRSDRVLKKLFARPRYVGPLRGEGYDFDRSACEGEYPIVNGARVFVDKGHAEFDYLDEEHGHEDTKPPPEYSLGGYPPARRAPLARLAAMPGGNGRGRRLLAGPRVRMRESNLAESGVLAKSGVAPAEDLPVL